MFNNDGYTCLHEVRERFLFRMRDIRTQHDLLGLEKWIEAQRRLPSDSFRLDSYFELSEANRVEAVNGIADREVFPAVQVSCDVAFRYYLLGQTLFLGGPDGHVVPVSRSVAGPLRPQTRRADRRWDFLSDRFLNVDAEGKLKLVEAAKTLLAHVDDITPSSEVRRSLERIVEMEPAIRGLLPFQGYCLSIKSSAVPDMDTIRMALGLRFQGGDIQSKTTAVGRPRKIEDAADAYSNRFPNGHGGYTWKEVRAILREEGGLDVSEDTLRRAVMPSQKD